MAPAATIAVVSAVEAEVNVIAEVFPPAGAPVQVHNPFPTAAALPPKAGETDPVHADLFPPLEEVVGGAITVNVKTEIDEVQPVLEIVHLKI